MTLRKRIGLTAVREILLVLGMVLLAGSLTGKAQSLVGDYHGTVLIGDTTGTVTPVEFAQSIDIALHIERDKAGTYSGKVRFRRLYRNRQGQLADAEGPLERLVINENDQTLEAVSAPIIISLGGRTIERRVSIVGTFVFSDTSPCIPSITADYRETVRGLVFRPLILLGPLSMARLKDTSADDDCLAAMNEERRAKGKR